ncbi:MAG: hypothetical protein NC099_06240 [Corallococcus sp.]|nr:hypothetical protein [Bacillota bacterium]MCM1534232.1 hypothetical protein [Corallococcus sp.]
MKQEKRAITKTLVITLPLRLFGCKYDDDLRIDVYDNGEVNVFLPVSVENLKVTPNDLDTCGQCVLDFEMNEKDPDKAYRCTTFGYSVWVEKPIEYLLKKEER